MYFFQKREPHRNNKFLVFNVAQLALKNAIHFVNKII
jgi:hypothetical protein